MAGIGRGGPRAWRLDGPAEAAANVSFWQTVTGLFTYFRRAMELTWTTSRFLSVAIGCLTLVSALLPAAVAWVGSRIVDAVLKGITLYPSQGSGAYGGVISMVMLEAGLVITMSAASRATSTCQSLLRAQLGNRVNVMILEKALTLDLLHFEDSEFYDKLLRARREASVRPLSMVMRTFTLCQNVLSLLSYAAILLGFSPLAVLVLFLAGIPVFVAEAKFSGDAFRLFNWRSEETRMMNYLETALTREENAKEMKLYNLGPLFLQRYKDIFVKTFEQDRALTLRRDSWGFGLGLLSTFSFYGAYCWIGIRAVQGKLSLGEMTMYLLLFKQGQSALSSCLTAIGGLYEDNLYLSNLYEYLEQEIPLVEGGLKRGPDPDDGIRFENVSFTYPKANRPALENISLHLRPGSTLALVGENGSGKTTLIKLMTRLYQPTTGRILFEGKDLREWDHEALRDRIGVIFQDFVRYQLSVGENIGAGDLEQFTDKERWRDAAQKGLADPFIQDLPKGYDQQLGQWFKDGRELSGGQWQKIALSRAFMRTRADVLVLDEPTAAMDAAAEADLFEHFRQLTKGRIAILISHRFSTVRMADLIVMLEKGRVMERGSHAELMALPEGRYSRLFTLQARGYK
jgi:ATP-binding cassette subfamily B protein